MGRLTPSFRTVYAEVLEDMRKEIQGCFIDLGHKAAFDPLLKEAWGPEEAAMGNSTLVTVLDKMVMVANIHNRKLIANFSEELKKRDPVLSYLSGRIESLEKRMEEESILELRGFLDKIPRPSKMVKYD